MEVYREEMNFSYEYNKESEVINEHNSKESKVAPVYDEQMNEPLGAHENWFITALSIARLFGVGGSSRLLQGRRAEP